MKHRIYKMYPQKCQHFKKQGFIRLIRKYPNNSTSCGRTHVVQALSLRLGDLQSIAVSFWWAKGHKFVANCAMKKNVPL